MSENDRIEYLNKEIMRKKKEIKNLELFESTIASTLAGGIIIGGTFTIIKNYHVPIIQYLTPALFLSTLLVGSYPCVLVPTRRSLKKKIKYDKEIGEAINELHGYAIEEDKKIMLKKKQI